MADCFWTDLVGVTQECESAPVGGDDGYLYAAAQTTNGVIRYKRDGSDLAGELVAAFSEAVTPTDVLPVVTGQQTLLHIGSWVNPRVYKWSLGSPNYAAIQSCGGLAAVALGVVDGEICVTNYAYSNSYVPPDPPAFLGNRIDRLDSGVPIAGSGRYAQRDPSAGLNGPFAFAKDPASGYLFVADITASGNGRLVRFSPGATTYTEINLKYERVYEFAGAESSQIFALGGYVYVSLRQLGIARLPVGITSYAPYDGYEGDIPLALTLSQMGGYDAIGLCAAMESGVETIYFTTAQGVYKAAIGGSPVKIGDATGRGVQRIHLPVSI